MKKSIKKELAAHIIDKINDRVIDNSCVDDWHYFLFNEDYYLVGYYEGEKWLERHNISAFEALDIIYEYEEENFGEGMTGVYKDAETIVNMFVYICGEKLLSEFDGDSVEELEYFCQNIL